MEAMGFLDIAEVAEMTGMKPSTLRYYEKLGLIEPDHRIGQRRQYQSEVVGRLAILSLCQEAGFDLDAVAKLLKAESDWRVLIWGRLDEVRDQIESLKRAEVALKHALECPSKDLVSCPHLSEAAFTSLARRARSERSDVAGANLPQV